MFAVLLDLLLRPFTKTHTILKDIGSGSFGTILLTRSKVDHALYVAKFIKRKKIKEYVPDAYGELPLEIYLLSRLSHPNIITCAGCYKLPQHWVFTMPYLEHFVDLKTFIKMQGRLSEQAARTVLIQTYDALVYCLSSGVDHRDVKHQNILVDKNTLQIKLIDFGLSSVCDSKTVYTKVQGTELFLPPEAIVQRRYTPLESSTWSLGCLLYCMVCGHAPFSSRKDIVFTEPHYPAYLSAFCKDFLALCLKKVRHQRLRFESVRWHTWMNIDRYRNFLQNNTPQTFSGTPQTFSGTPQTFSGSPHIGNPQTMMNSNTAQALMNSNTAQALMNSNTAQALMNSNLSHMPGKQNVSRNPNVSRSVSNYGSGLSRTLTEHWGQQYQYVPSS